MYVCAGENASYSYFPLRRFREGGYRPDSTNLICGVEGWKGRAILQAPLRILTTTRYFLRQCYDRVDYACVYWRIFSTLRTLPELRIKRLGVAVSYTDADRRRRRRRQKLLVSNAKGQADRLVFYEKQMTLMALFFKTSEFQACIWIN